MLNRIALIAVLLVAVLSFGCAKQVDGERRAYFVRSVIDGDTIELSNGKRVRYIGVDTPETRKKIAGKWVFDPEDFSVNAKNFNSSLVKGSKIKLVFDVNKEDKYGRWLAYVYTDNGLFANEELIKEGLSLVYTIPPNIRYFESFIRAQNEARRNKRGLWKAINRITPEQARSMIGKYAIVAGRCDSIIPSGNRFYLHIHGKNGDIFQCIIYAGNAEEYFRGTQSIDRFKGEEVEVIGKIEDRSGPVMIIDNPSQIEIVSYSNES